MSDDVVDLTEAFDEEAVPMCPICESLITEEEPAGVITAHGCRMLAHYVCIDGARYD